MLSRGVIRNFLSKNAVAGHYIHQATNNYSCVTRTSPKLTYNSETLKFLNRHGESSKWINFELKKHLNDVGLLRSFRGCRSGKSLKHNLLNERRKIHTHIHGHGGCSAQSFTKVNEKKQLQNSKRGFHTQSNLVYIKLDGKNTSYSLNTNNLSSVNTNLKLCSMNCQSVCNKTARFVDYAIDCNADVFALTETWLNKDDTASLATPDGFTFSHCPRVSNRSGGGTALVFKNSIRATNCYSGEKQSFEFSEWIVSHKSFKMRISIIYRPPYSTNHPVTASTFFTEFSDYLESIILTLEPLLITGDFNFHCDVPSDNDSRTFLDLLESMGLMQHVNQPTHTSGHTLDLVITRKSDDILAKPPVVDHLFSDHLSVLAEIKTSKPRFISKTVSFRKIKDINLQAFKHDLTDSDLYRNPPSTLDDLVRCYNLSLEAVLNKHAPLRAKKIVHRPRVPWFSNDIKTAKRQRRKAEKKWLSSKSPDHLTAFKSLRNCTTYLVNNAKREFYTKFIEDNSADQGKLFRAAKQLMFKCCSEKPLPEHTNKIQLANEMGNFFVQKIEGIRSKLDEANKSTSSENIVSSDSNSIPVVTEFSSFQRMGNESVLKLVCNAPSKSCPLDPLPTKLVKDCMDVLLPSITAMINTSLESGQFANTWKEAIVTPLLKKDGAELIYNNYRPVSNLSFVSKLTEKVVASQLTKHMNDGNLYPEFQSAYRKSHSTETALLKVKNDILLNMNKQHVTLLILLDLSAAFDTVDHEVLLKRLHSQFRISGTVLAWFSSYLSDRTQIVSVDGNNSSTFQLKNYGVPQGSCLGPLLFTIYASELFNIVKTHLPNIHGFADDTQLYLSFSPNDEADQKHALRAMEKCIADVREWMLRDRLMINDDKTEFLLIGTKQQLAKVNIPHIKIGHSEIQPSHCARNLGAWFDSQMKMVQHINKTCSSVFYYLHNIRKVRKYLSRENVETLVHAFISSRIDYCNSLLYGTPQCHLMKLQRAQNAAARLVCNVPKFDHISPFLQELHWLPIKYRIEFKILLLTHKAIHGAAPGYIKDLISLRNPSRVYNLRSNNDIFLLQLPRFKSSPTLGDASFTCAAPKLWNSLPANIRKTTYIDNFKSLLKTHLFKCAFLNF